MADDIEWDESKTAPVSPSSIEWDEAKTAPAGTDSRLLPPAEARRGDDQGALQAAAHRGVDNIPLAPQLSAAWRAAQSQLAGSPTSFGEDYRQARTEFERQNAAGKALHPGSSRVGGALGFGATLAVPGGAGLMGAAKAGALYGAGGAVDDASNGDYGAAAASVPVSIGGALAFHGLAGGAGSAVGKVSPWLADKLEQLGVAQGKRVITGGANHLSGRSTISDEAVKQALENKSIGYFNTTAQVAKKLDAVRQSQGAEYASILRQLEDRGVTGPKAEELADELSVRAQHESDNGLNQAIPAEYAGTAKNILTKPLDGNGNLSLSQAEAMKRSLQDQVRYGKYEETPLNEVKGDIASRLRQSVEDEIHGQAEQSQDPAVKALAERFIPVKQQLGRTIEADQAAIKGADQASKRNAISIRDLGVGGGVSAAMGPVAGAAAGGLSYLARTRGTSTLARGLYGTGQALRGATAPIMSSMGAGATSGRFAQVLANIAAQHGPEAATAAHFVMSQSPGNYQEEQFAARDAK